MHANDDCASAQTSETRNPTGVAGFCHCRPNDLQPHLVAVDPGGRLDAGLKCWSSFDKEGSICLRIRKEADDPKGKYVQCWHLADTGEITSGGSGSQSVLGTTRRLVQQ